MLGLGAEFVLAIYRRAYEKLPSVHLEGQVKDKAPFGPDADSLSH